MPLRAINSMWAFLDGSGLTPHGFCLSWQPGLLWLHALSDFVAGAAYLSIPFALILLIRRRGAIVFNRMFMLFASFILACGAAHFMAIVTLWEPLYVLEGGVKAATAALSVVTACQIGPLLAGIERSEARYRILAEHATDVIFELDLSLQLQYVSPACEAIFDRSPAEIMAMSAGDMIHPDDRAMVLHVWRTMAAGAERGEVLYRGRRRDGLWIWVEVAMRLVRDMRGGPRSIVGIARDVTVRKAAEDSLRASEARYRLLADNMMNAVVTLDADLRRTYVSPSFRELMGYDPDEALGASPRDIVHPDDWPAVAAMLTAVRDGVAQDAVPLRATRKNGAVIWLELQSQRLSDGTGLIASLSEITRRKAIEDQLVAANVKLEALARTDSLTGLANRRSLDESLENEFRRCLRSASPLSLILLDVDNFKSYNDCYGHQAGDRCLQAVGRIVAGSARRPGDLAVRYGGEEFAIILPGVEPGNASALAETLRIVIHDAAIEHLDNPGRVVTASFGVATMVPTDPSQQPAELIEHADRLLYKAKASGRNIVASDVKAA